MVNNLRQLGENHCTSIIPLIKQNALKRNNNLLVYYNKPNEKILNDKNWN